MLECLPKIALSVVAALVAVLLLICLLYFLTRGRCSLAVSKWLLKIFAYAYILRFALISAALLLGIFVAATKLAGSLLGNLFDINWHSGIILLSFTAFVAAWVIMVSWRLTLLYGDKRFKLQSFIDQPFKVSPNVGWRHVVGFGSLALPVVFYAVFYTIRQNPGDFQGAALLALMAVIGLAFALLLLGVAAFVHKLITIPSKARRPQDKAEVAPDLAGTSPDFFLPTQGRRLKSIFGWAEKTALAKGLGGRVDDLIRRLRPDPDVWRGYFEFRQGSNEVAEVLPGHEAAAILALVALIFYAAVSFAKFCLLGAPPYFPTLGYVLLLVILLCLLLSGLAFFFDRYRIPVMLPLLILLVVTSLMPWSDHYFAVVERDAPLPAQTPAPAPTPAPTPAAADAAGASPAATATPARPDSIIVVAVNGGGIQAAAWAAHVLTGLQCELGDDFGRMVRVVSSVSGGSVGAMYFVNEYEGGRPPAVEELPKIIERVEGSSLDEIAWGLVGPDAVRLLTSYGSDWDRGRALEYALLREDLEDRHDPAKKWPGRERVMRSLSSWGVEAAAGLRPGMIFNTTISDTGQRLPLATVALPPGSEGQRVQKKFFDNIGGKDLQVVTAARLSASFPYVSPAARADFGGWWSKQPHVVDGGYYDNYGISSLVEWLDHELEGGRIGRVLFVEIRGGPTPDEDGGEAAMGYEFKSRRGWFYQAFAPLSTLLHVRDTGQFSHNRIELRLLIDKWKDNKVDIRDAVFEFEVKKPEDDDPPLSWHLNQQEKNRLVENWKRELRGAKKPKSVLVPDDRGKRGLEIVREFVSHQRPAAATPAAPPAPPVCRPPLN